MKHILYKASQYYALTKPRVAQLAVFCAVIGMCLAARGAVPWRGICSELLGRASYRCADAPHGLAAIGARRTGFGADTGFCNADRRTGARFTLSLDYPPHARL